MLSVLSYLPFSSLILSEAAQEQRRERFDLAVDLVIDEPGLYVACGVMSVDDLVNEHNSLIWSKNFYRIKSATSNENNRRDVHYF